MSPPTVHCALSELGDCCEHCIKNPTTRMFRNGKPHCCRHWRIVARPFPWELTP